MESRQVQIIRIDAGVADQRLDNFLLKILKGLPKSRVYRIIRKGEVRINGKRARPQTRLNVGDEVRVPPIRHLPERGSAVGHFRDLDRLILFEDSHLLVLNKPAGMAVHGGSGVNAGVIESLRHARKDLAGAELVHRLDRGTSGCLMVAKKRSYLKLLQDALRNPGTISKTYLAVIHGEMEKASAVEQPLLTVSKTGQERFTRVDQEGKPAKTLFNPVVTATGLTLVEASPLTGRTHQIRVHARWQRQPIIGDDRYGDTPRDSLLPMKPARMMLHAARLSIPSLGDRTSLEITAPVDISFNQFVESCLHYNIN